MENTRTYEGWIGPEGEKTYFHVPFEVPPGTDRLDVTLAYNDRIGSNPALLGGNTVDLGVFDERGITFLSAGFRGWSGSERDGFWITPAEASPGYLAGPVNAGTWHVLLGLYKVAPEGCRYRVEVTVRTGEGGAPAEPEPAHPSGPLPASRPAAPFAPWLRGELHCHTLHSDGLLTTADVVARARARGLDFLAIADHNTTAALGDLAGMTDPGLVLVRGVESTTYQGHFVAWGISDWIDFRVTRPEEMAAAIQTAKRLGALTACAHPKPLGPGWDFPEVANYDCIEIWNGPWNGLNAVSLAYWLERIGAGERIPAVGGSDFHREGERAGGRDRDLGTPTNWVYLPGEASEARILAALRGGRASLSASPDGPLVTLQAGPGGAILQGDTLQWRDGEKLPVRIGCLNGAGGVLRLLDQNGVLLERQVAGDAETFEAEVTVAGSRYVRAELRDESDWLRAITNPVYGSTS